MEQKHQCHQQPCDSEFRTDFVPLLQMEWELTEELARHSFSWQNVGAPSGLEKCTRWLRFACPAN